MNDTDIFAAQQKTINSIVDSIFGTPTKLTPPQEVLQTLQAARSLEVKVMFLRDLFPDNRGNLEQGEEFMRLLIKNLEGHLLDMKAGKEIDIVCDCDKCDDRKRDGELCEGRR